MDDKFKEKLLERKHKMELIGIMGRMHLRYDWLNWETVEGNNAYWSMKKLEWYNKRNKDHRKLIIGASEDRIGVLFKQASTIEVVFSPKGEDFLWQLIDMRNEDFGILLEEFETLEFINLYVDGEKWDRETKKYIPKTPEGFDGV